MRFIWLTSAATAAALALPVQAQGVDETDTILVTATRREQSLQEVPLSVTALSGAQLEARGILDVTTLANSVPGLTFGRSGSDARPAIRGVRTEEVDAANDPVVGFYVDGIYKPRTSQALAAFVDLERVEVLRGPQGTLFGRNTYGGSINLISRLPTPDLGFSGSIRYASFDDIRLEGMVNVPVTDKVGVRLVGLWQQSDGFVKVEDPRVPAGGKAEDFNDNDQWYVRGTIAATPTENFDIALRISHWNQGGFGAGGFGYTTVGTLRQNPGAGPGQATGPQDLGGFLDRTNPRAGATPAPSDLDPYRVFRNTDLTRETKETAVSLDMNLTLSGVRVRSLTGYSDFSAYRKGDEDFSESAGSLLELDTQSESFSQEVQLLSDYDSPVQWILGFYYFNESAVEDFFFRTPANPNAFTFRQDVSTDSLALFGHVEWAVTPELSIVGGLRQTWDIKRFIYQSPVGAPDLNPDKAEFAKLTWQAGANYKLTPSNLLYVTVSTGFRSGGFNNGGNPPVPFYGPQTVTAYEVGSKNSFPDANLTVNVAGFYNNYEDILSNTFVQVGPTNVVARSNAGSSRAYGIEAEATWEPVEKLFLDANLTWLNARFKTFQATRPLALATGYTLVPGTTNQLDLSGNRVPLAPDFTVAVGGRYEFGLGSIGTLTPEVRFFWSDDYFANEFNYDAGIEGRAVGRQPSYTSTDISLTWQSADSRFLVRGFVQNLEDRAILNRVVIGGQGAIFQNYAAPRIFGVTAGFTY